MHGLKGVHQLMSSLTMAIHQKAVPHRLFIRSSEIHNQDIVSNAMNAGLNNYELEDILANVCAAGRFGESGLYFR